ncbi:MAG: UDP-N-acetylglucosamine--N-acetylmuramyl-(pentapeptide) pyrophosphoryl-undecaprenol N-acetylglucosamine transferase [Candidatus Liptonbacteria bacterium]|nr:UDP-N-acetylglucosamine--N-acetylmuramyl-(pentapeptide) pyrophosphoryl-undecaprenol N-acetylglucosamine transferase [Candidatus Liptonbacteria bacterium]
MNKQIVRILFTGGGSGGHIYPILAVAEEVRRLAAELGATVELHYLGPQDRYSETLTAAGITLHGLVGAKLRRYFSLQNFLDVPKFFWALLQALFKVYAIMPDEVFSKGGTGAWPVVLAARFYRIPVMIHESDATPGLTNLLSRPFALRVAVSFESARHYFRPERTLWVGNPIRSDLLVNALSPDAAKEQLGFNKSEPLLLVLGGSQGSERLNDFIIDNLSDILPITQVFHQVGYENLATVERTTKALLMNLPIETEAKHPYQVVPFFEDAVSYRNALSAADLVLARSGSGTLTEIAAFGKPAILVPMPDEFSNGHQRVNAYEFTKTGGGVVMEESNLMPRFFLKHLKDILTNPETIARMAQASASFFRPNAARAIAEELLRIA